MLVFNGGNFLRQRLALSTITGKPITIKSIRADEPLNPGLSDSETNLLHLLDSVTDGSRIKINDTGTTLNYTPGIIIGGGTSERPLIHNCHPSRALSYYLEFLLLIIPFGRDKLYMKLTGITDSNEVDHSIDIIRMVTIPLIQKIIPQMKDLSLNILNRSINQEYPGIVSINIPNIYKIEPIMMDGSIGRVKRIRGVAWYTNSASAQIAIKMISIARGIMNRFIPDVWIYLDKPKKDLIQKKELNGFGITLISETLNGLIKGSDCCSIPTLGDLQKKLDNSFENIERTTLFKPIFEEDLDLEFRDTNISIDRASNQLRKNLDTGNYSTLESYKSIIDNFRGMTEWEKVGWLASTKLLLEVDSQSIVDTSHQVYPLLFMSLSQDTAVSRLKLSKLTPITIQFLRDLRNFTNVEFSIKEELNSGTFVTLSCTGIGFSNFSRRAA